MFYAGIGSRETPWKILRIMKHTAQLLAIDEYGCSTGAANGADQAFATAAHEMQSPLHLYLPWPSYEQNWVNSKRCALTDVTILNDNDIDAITSVYDFHPAANKLKPAIIKLHARNYLIIKDVLFVVCYTPDGKGQGGTGQGIKIAQSMNIPVYDLGNKATLAAFEAKINERRNEIP